MAYAGILDVKARAGALARAWTADSTPSDSDIEAFLAQTAAEIDALLESRGLTPPAAGTTAAAALAGVNADAALVLALTATYPQSSGPASASKEIDDARARVTAATKQLLDGTSPVVALLESTTSTAPTASNFFTNEPTYEYPPQVGDLRDENPHLVPGVWRNQRF